MLLRQRFWATCSECGWIAEGYRKAEHCPRCSTLIRCHEGANGCHPVAALSVGERVAATAGSYNRLPFFP
jgi:hypothetical protein